MDGVYVVLPSLGVDWGLVPKTECSSESRDIGGVCFWAAGIVTVYEGCRCGAL